MKRDRIWALLPILSCILIFLSRSAGGGMLADTDTAFLLKQIEIRNNPWSWFVGDWPLLNHFYRPISTLFFEFDWRMYGTNAGGYALTQALIAIACVLAAWWMLVELSGSKAQGAIAGAVFGFWTAGAPVEDWIKSALWILAIVALLGLFQGGFRKVGVVLCALLGIAFWAIHFSPPFMIHSRIVQWLPGRTASVMAIFCFLAVAAYARYERRRQSDPVAEPTALDIPPTRGSSMRSAGNAAERWLIPLMFLSIALALGSYEQAVMLPAILTGVAILFKLQGRKIQWWIPAASWAVLVGYVVLRRVVVPSQTSKYQAQQFRDGPGVGQSLIEFLAPGLNRLTGIRVNLESFPLSYFDGSAWINLIALLGNAVILVWAWRSRNRWAFFASLLFAFVSFLPMAFLKMFEHYYFWPAAFWAWMVVQGCAIGWERLLNAIGPQPIQAPPRTDP